MEEIWRYILREGNGRERRRETKVERREREKERQREGLRYRDWERD
jgi:hypothetical protein